MFDIVNALRRSPAVKQVQVIDLIDEATVKYLKCRAELADGSTLHINESSVLGRNKYSYHWQDAQNQLIVRWDNAPHHRHLSSFPHHRHESGTVHESPRVSIDEVLTEKDIFNFMEDSIQKIIELYKRDVDRTLIRENLKLTAEERLLKLQNFVEFAEELRKAGRKIGRQKTMKGKEHGD